MRRRVMNKMIAVDELAAFVLDQEDNWASLVEHLKNGGDPDKHIMYLACFVAGCMGDFKTAVIENHPEINTSEKYDSWYNFNDGHES